MENIENINEIPLDLIDIYKSKVDEGKELWKDKKVVICGLARNCENKIDSCIDRIRTLAKYFSEYKIIVFENNSTDQTKEKLNNYSDIINIGKDDSEDFSNGFSERRVVRLSRYRDCIQNYIKNKYSNYDYVIVVDFDITDWAVDGIITSLAWDKDFDVMGSFSQVYHPTLQSGDGWIHYDRWAFKFHSWTEEWSEKQGSDMRWFWYWKPPIGAKPIPCLSVFGGLAIYKMEPYLIGKYGYKHPEQLDGCITSEHNQFHYTLHNSGYNKIYLNPSQRCII